MKQVTGFTRERIVKILGVFHDFVLCDIARLQWFF